MVTKAGSVEVEAKILDIDSAAVVSRLQNIGASEILNDTTVIETYDRSASLALYEQDPWSARCRNLLQTVVELQGKDPQSLLAQGAYLRLRREGDNAEILLKYPVKGETGVKSEQEVQVPIATSEWALAASFLRRQGFRQIMYQEKRRRSFLYTPLSVRFDIDTWPGIPTYVEIEGPHKSAIIDAARLLGYDESDLSSMNARALFRHYGVNGVYLRFADDGDEELPIADIRTLAEGAIMAAAPHISVQDAELIADHYIDADLRAKRTHGLHKLGWDIQFYGERKGSPAIIKDNGPLVSIEGNQEIGPLAADYCAQIVIDRARRYGIAAVGMVHTQRFGMLHTWTDKIARAGLIGIVTVSTEPFVALPGTKQGSVGTNPLSVAVPYKEQPIVYDAALSAHPMSEVWLQKRRGGKLPESSFIDQEGKYTTDPYQARYAVAFGGAKGAGLMTMLQMLSGPLLGVDTQHSLATPYENGFFFQAIDPSFFQGNAQFNSRVEGLAAFIKTASEDDEQGARLPGERSRQHKRHTEAQGTIAIAKRTVGLLRFLKDNA